MPCSAQGAGFGFGTPEEAPADTVMQRPPNLVLNKPSGIGGQEPPSIPWPPIESIPEQERTGTRFGMDAQGRIDVLQIPPASDDLQRFHYDEMRHKAEALATLGQMLGDTAPAVNSHSSSPAGTHRGRVRRQALVARQYPGRATTRMFERSPTISGLTPRACILSSLQASATSSTASTSFVLGDPRGRELDQIRLGPQDREAARRIAELAAPIASAVSRRSIACNACCARDVGRNRSRLRLTRRTISTEIRRPN